MAWAPETTEPAWMAARIAAGRGWIAARAGRDAGFLVAAGLDGEGPALLDLFFVRPEARGSGVASALLAAFDTAAAGRPCTAFASLYLRPILERRGWRMVRADPTERSGEFLMRYLMERPA
jgi:GNAT superfamily N-acetyltransferase